MHVSWAIGKALHKVKHISYHTHIMHIQPHTSHVKTMPDQWDNSWIWSAISVLELRSLWLGLLWWQQVTNIEQPHTILDTLQAQVNISVTPYPLIIRYTHAYLSASSNTTYSTEDNFRFISTTTCINLPGVAIILQHNNNQQCNKRC